MTCKLAKVHIHLCYVPYKDDGCSGIGVYVQLDFVVMRQYKIHNNEGVINKNKIPVPGQVKEERAVDVRHPQLF